MSQHVHTYPMTRERQHDTIGLDCWCAPKYLLPCDECDRGCWKCTNGSIELTRAEAEHAPRPLVIVHNP